MLVLVGLIVLTVVLAARNRPAQPMRPRYEPYRVRGRSVRGWQASVIRELRRAGRASGRRGP